MQECAYKHAFICGKHALGKRCCIIVAEVNFWISSMKKPNIIAMWMSFSKTEKVGYQKEMVKPNISGNPVV